MVNVLGATCSFTRQKNQRKTNSNNDSPRDVPNKLETIRGLHLGFTYSMDGLVHGPPGLEPASCVFVWSVLFGKKEADII